MGSEGFDHVLRHIEEAVSASPTFGMLSSYPREETVLFQAVGKIEIEGHYPVVRVEVPLEMVQREPEMVPDYLLSILGEAVVDLSESHTMQQNG